MSVPEEVEKYLNERREDVFTSPSEHLSLEQFKRYVRIIFSQTLSCEDIVCIDSQASPQSPIEWKMYFALRAIFYGLHNSLNHYDPMLAHFKVPHLVTIEPQKHIGPYRVDFLVTFHLLGKEDKLSVVVECDGHEFHERTKAQAQKDKKRDRDITQAGFRVMRFTGSEIYKDPFACASEVHRLFLRRPFNEAYAYDTISEDAIDWDPYAYIGEKSGNN